MRTISIIGSGAMATAIAGRTAKAGHTVEVVSRIRDLLPAFRQQLPASVKLEVLFDRSATVIGFFGKNSSNDDDRKGTDIFTKALVSLKQRIPHLTVLIIGPGWQRLTSELIPRA